MIEIAVLLGIHLAGSCYFRVNANSVDLIVPDHVDVHDYPNFVSESLYKDNETINEDVPLTSTDDANSVSCQLYMAPSTIPNSGMGVFAGQSFNEGDEVGEPDSSVLFVDMLWNNDVSTNVFHNNFLWDEYTWMPDIDMLEPGRYIQRASFGINSLANCYLPLVNIISPDIEQEIATVKSGMDPGSGAFTVYHNQRNLALKDIGPGDELFIDYGMGYFLNRTSIYGLMPMNMHYDRADKLLDQLRTVVETIQGNRKRDMSIQDIDISLLEKIIKALPSAAQDALTESDLIEMYKQHQMEMDEKKSSAVTNKKSQALEQQDLNETESASVGTELFTLVKLIMQTWPSRTEGAIPESYAAANHVLEVFGSTQFNHAERSKRDLDWLRSHGSCLDNLSIKNSTIQHAGLGAFAKRFLPEGSIVAPVPLLHLPEREIFNMYEGFLTPFEGKYKRDQNNLIHYQLMLNYCFGHRASSLLLCPYGVASSLVNHKVEANTKIVWSKKMTSRPEWLDMPVIDWAYNYKTGLAFDYVAIRDIHEGEEVLIDYGNEWQAAWDTHLESWTPKQYQSQILNEQDPPVEIPKYDEWPWQDVHLWCRNIYRMFQGLLWAQNNVYPCRVISKAVDKASKEVLYTTEVLVRFHGEKEDFTEEYEKRPDLVPQPDNFCSEEFDEIMFNLPRDAFIFGGAYHWDEHTRYQSKPWSFRHDLRIPDDIMPEKWKNL